jgi:excisionase family DNA binding protein
MHMNHDTRPKYGPFDTWQKITGLGRSKTYEMLQSGELRGIMVGRRLLIDIEAGLAALAAMPPARIGKGEAAGSVSITASRRSLDLRRTSAPNAAGLSNDP